MFDHIGFLVSEEEKYKICENAKKMNWVVDRNERRTFIRTPYNFRIELKVDLDVIDSLNDEIKIEKLKLVTIMEGLERGLSKLFNKPIDNIICEVGNEVTIKGVLIKGLPSSDIFDPNGVRLV